MGLGLRISSKPCEPVAQWRHKYTRPSLPVITTRLDALVTAPPSACKRSDWCQSQNWREL